MPAFRRRQVSWTIRQRLTRLLTCAMRTRRRAMRRFAAFCARVRARAPRLLRWHDDLDVVEGERQEAEILEQPAARGQRVRGRLSEALIVDTTRRGLTQKENRAHRIDQQHVLHRVALFLAAIRARLLSRILGTREAPCGAIVAKRGEAGAEAGAVVGRSADGSDPSSGATMAAASTSATPRRFASSVTDRVGASPSVRSVDRSTPKRT